MKAELEIQIEECVQVEPTLSGKLRFHFEGDKFIITMQGEDLGGTDAFGKEVCAAGDGGDIAIATTDVSRRQRSLVTSKEHEAVSGLVRLGGKSESQTLATTEEYHIGVAEFLPVHSGGELAPKALWARCRRRTSCN